MSARRAVEPSPLNTPRTSQACPTASAAALHICAAARPPVGEALSAGNGAADAFEQLNEVAAGCALPALANCE